MPITHVAVPVVRVLWQQHVDGCRGKIARAGMSKDGCIEVRQSTDLEAVARTLAGSVFFWGGGGRYFVQEETGDIFTYIYIFNLAMYVL